jgi:hypothetical protein
MISSLVRLSQMCTDLECNHQFAARERRKHMRHVCVPIRGHLALPELIAFGRIEAGRY